MSSNLPTSDTADTMIDKPGVYIKTHGCQMNEYDSRKLLKILEAGYTQVGSPEEASLVIINTCSVREKPEQKLYSALGRLQELKAENPRLLVGVGGCVAQQEGQNIINKSKTVDFVFGTHNLSLVPALIDARSSGKGPQVAVDYRDEWEDLPLGLGGDSRVSAYVSISRGCNKDCSYCIVPTTRGKEVSRPIEELLREVRLLAHRGAREVILLGQTVNSYGLDLNPRISFVDLLSRVSDISGVERIRFMSPHPQEIRQDFIDFLADCPKICRHIHMPLQSGSNRILKLMNRNYKREKYLRIIETLKSRVPDVSISTDLIIGFPSETEKDFQDSMEILESVRFDSSYSFIFSPRPGTIASTSLADRTLIDEVSEDEKRERLARWQQRQNEITAENLEQWVGKTSEVLIEGASMHNPELLRGRTSQNFVVNLQTKVPKLKLGMFAAVKLTEVSRYTMKGEFLEILQRPAQAVAKSTDELIGNAENGSDSTLTSLDKITKLNMILPNEGITII